jgi:hypothetical protein
MTQLRKSVKRSSPSPISGAQTWSATTPTSGVQGVVDTHESAAKGGDLLSIETGQLQAKRASLSDVAVSGHAARLLDQTPELGFRTTVLGCAVGRQRVCGLRFLLGARRERRGKHDQHGNEYDARGSAYTVDTNSTSPATENTTPHGSGTRGQFHRSSVRKSPETRVDGS